MVKLTLIDLMTHEEYELPENFKEVKIGRFSYGNDIELPDGNSLKADKADLERLAKRISRHHCTIQQKEGKVAIMDNNSKNGVYINEKKIETGKAYLLKDGYKLSLGKKYKLDVEIEEEEELKLEN